MAKSFHDSFDVAKAAFDEASAVMGLDMAKLCFEGPEELLNRTEYTQPALLTSSIATLRVLYEKTSFRPSFFAGHSLGEYTALVAAGSLDFKEAVRLVHLRGVFMQESVPAGVGKMCAIIGLTLPDVQVICDSASIDAAQVVPANINSPEQIVISGAAAAVDIAAGMAKDRGARMVVPLQVSAPSHSPLMENAAERLASELDKITIKDPATPVYTNVEAEPLTSKARIKELLCLQLTSPVRWVDIVRQMKADGAVTVVEVGPGKVLTGLVKRTEKDLNTINLKDAADLEKVVGVLGA
jgi:[acyl-carrier-protein] S-malonyltransferase